MGTKNSKSKLQRSLVDFKTQLLFIIIKLNLCRGGMSSGMDRQNLDI